MSQQPPIDYRPGNKPLTDREAGELGKPQAIFDTVGGPNLRVKDNLIQLMAAAVGLVLGMLVGLLLPATSIPLEARLMGGAIGGAIFGVFLSGAILGVYRFVKTVRGKKR